MNKLIDEIIKGNKRAVSRAITIIENSVDDAREIINKIYPNTGNALRIGITGPPGAGKSTLTNHLASLLSNDGSKTGILAVDPTSPFSGGALLGDRVRMNDIGMNQNILIRSMATRGSLGGLSTKAIDAADIVDAAGYKNIIFETVGVGQSELDILNASDIVIVILVPESGDSIQAMKAGLMEIADLFVLNKCDRPGADSAYNALKTILSLRYHDEKTWMIPVLKTIASSKQGLDELSVAINQFIEHQNKFGLFSKRRKNNFITRIKNIVEKDISHNLWENINLNTMVSNSENNSPFVIARSITSNLNKKDLHI